MPKISGSIKLRLMIQPPKGYVPPPPSGMRLLPPIVVDRPWTLKAGSVPTDLLTPVNGKPGLVGSTGAAHPKAGVMIPVMPENESVGDPPEWRLQRRKPRRALDPSWKHANQPPLTDEQRRKRCHGGQQRPGCTKQRRGHRISG